MPQDLQCMSGHLSHLGHFMSFMHIMPAWHFCPQPLQANSGHLSHFMQEWQMEQQSLPFTSI
jgi:hypothetical protein